LIVPISEAALKAVCGRCDVPRSLEACVTGDFCPAVLTAAAVAAADEDVDDEADTDDGSRNTCATPL